MGANADKPVLMPATLAEWETWLQENDAHTGVRLQLRKKESSAPGITYPEALEAALCFGWIDGQAASVDGDYHLRVFTPRRPRSVWSQRNRDLVERLEAEGRMRPAGLEQVARAQADGRWAAAYRQKGSPVPEDLRAALDASATAAAFFATPTAQNRFAILFRIGGVKRAETRAARIADYVLMLERGETHYPQGRGASH